MHIFHKYEEVNRQPLMKQEYWFGREVGRAEPVTVVTYKCTKYPKHKQITLKGWN